MKWEKNLCFCIAEKIFCIADLEDPHLEFSMKVSADDFDQLTSRNGIVPAPYLARNKWVLVEKVSALTHEEIKQFVTGSYELVKSKLPKKVLATLTT